MVHPHGCTHIELRWLNSSGPSVNAFVRAMQREVNTRALTLISLPARQSAPELANPLYNSLVLRLQSPEIVKSVVEWLVLEKSFVLDRPPVLLPQTDALNQVMPSATQRHTCTSTSTMSAPLATAGANTQPNGSSAPGAGSQSSANGKFTASSSSPACTLSQPLAEALTRARRIIREAVAVRVAAATDVANSIDKSGDDGLDIEKKAVETPSGTPSSTRAATAESQGSASSISAALSGFVDATSFLRASAQRVCEQWEVKRVLRPSNAQDGLSYLTLVHSNALAMVRVYSDKLVWVPVTLPSARTQLPLSVNLFRSLVAKCESMSDDES